MSECGSVCSQQVSTQGCSDPMISDLGLWRGAGREGVSEPGVARVGPHGGRGGLGRTQTTSTTFVTTPPCSSSTCLIFPHWVKPTPPRTPQAPLTPSSTFLLAESRRTSLPSYIQASSEPSKHQQKENILPVLIPQNITPETCTFTTMYGPIHHQGGMRTRMAGGEPSKARVLKADVEPSAGCHLDRCDEGFSCAVCRVKYFKMLKLFRPSICQAALQHSTVLAHTVCFLACSSAGGLHPRARHLPLCC